MDAGGGRAASFLREGWATYVESLVLAQEYGADTERLFWKEHARKYFQNYDGRRSILEDVSNSDLNYDKGSWIFRMLEGAVGSDGFRKAMTAYSRKSLAGDATFETFAECFHEQQADFDAQAFLRPWLEGKSAPRISVQTEGQRVNVRLEPPFTTLPVVVEAKTAAGTERRRVWVTSGGATLEYASEVTEARVDPDELLLLRR